MLKAIIFCFLIAFCAGCTQRYAVTYESEPYGATLYDGGGRQLGDTPVTLYYEPTDEAIKSGNIRLSPIKARWVSGASTDGPQMLSTHNGTSQTFKFMRPNNAPDYEKDRLYALLLLQSEINSLDRQVQFYQQQQLIQQQQQQQQQQTSPPVQQYQQNQTNCKTRVINGQIQTYCW
jgi:hypothetical protein